MADRVGQQLGHYRLLRVLGQGAFAEVYLGEHLYLERPAAIKVLHAQMEPEAQEQFRREARTIALLQHPHIVPVLDFGLDDQTPYLVMEYTPGGTLRALHPKGTRLPLEQVVTYVKQIASALDYAHQQHVIHRDVKPENLLLNTRHQVVLSDFGIAVIQPTMEPLSTQQPTGTPFYMAPEQIRGKPCPASDQYALAVVVYEWLCGEPPFRGSLFEVCSQHLFQPPSGLCARVPNLALIVEDAVLGALAKDPHQCFTNVQDFATALEAACDATQPLSSPVLAEREAWDMLASPAISSALMAAPIARAEDLSDETTQSQLTPAQRGDEQKPLPSVTLPTVAQSPNGLEQAKPSIAQRNRERLLRKVHSFWIAGVLEHSLHGAALIALGLDQQPEAVAHPWQLVLHDPAGATRPLPAGTRITEVYDAANGELLILGAPGSGKTTLLLELTRALLSRAEHDEQHPLPAVFNLSSWAMKQQPLADWLVEELNSAYQVPHMLGRAWVDADQILPLLDGLDEVALKNRTACIETINAYRQEHGLLPLVVCSRSTDYLTQTARVHLGSAVAVQPLTKEQVDDYLTSGGEPLGALRVALHRDTALREFASTPLMLSILALTYHGVPIEELVGGASLPDRQRQILAHYVEQMLRNRGAEAHYTQEQTTHWLSSLAGRMKRQSQAIFYLEQMQPTWLSSQRMLWWYNWLAVRLPGILIGALVSLIISMFIVSSFDLLSLTPIILLGGLLGGLLSEGSIPQQPSVFSRKARSPFGLRLFLWLLSGALIGLGSGLGVWLLERPIPELSFMLIYGLSLGLCTGLWGSTLQFLLRKNDKAAAGSPTPPPAKEAKEQRLIRRREVRIVLLVGLSTGLSGLLSIGLSQGVSYGLSGWLLGGLYNGLIYGLTSGLIFGLSAGFLSALLIGKSTTVQSADLLVWSWRSLFSKSHVSTTVKITVLIGLSVVLRSLITGLLEELSIRSSLGPIAGLSDILHTGVSFVLSTGLSDGLIEGLSLGLSYWLLLGLFQGMSSTTIEDQHRVVPNQGIHRSALNGLVLGLISTVIVGPLAWLSLVLSDGLSTWLDFGLGFRLNFALSVALPEALLAGLSAGLLVGLLKGGLASFRHYLLRFLLWHIGSVPWHYVPFLDFAAEHILLRKVGCGYIFIHRLLLEYFASLDMTPTHDVAKVRKHLTEPAS